jgi:hypothetical protein
MLDMINKSQFFDFAMARTALKYGLLMIKIKAGSVILIPDYICEVIRHPLQQLGIKIITYHINDDMSPNWLELEELQKKEPASAILMVHYFGQPQNICDFRLFCERFGVKLIEDAAHGHSGKHNGITLGTFGDIGISSPRKIFSKPFGGCLYLNKSVGDVELDVIRDLPLALYRIKDVLKSVIRFYSRLNALINGFCGVGRDWSNPFLFQESVKSDLCINKSEQEKFYSAKWNSISESRRASWIEWQDFALNNGLDLVFPMVASESCPWAFPAYAKDLEQRNWWLRWGARNGIPLFSWPALPTEEIKSGGEAYSRWKRLVCFPLDVPPHKMRIYKALRIKHAG